MPPPPALCAAAFAAPLTLYPRHAPALARCAAFVLRNPPADMPPSRGRPRGGPQARGGRGRGRGRGRGGGRRRPARQAGPVASGPPPDPFAGPALLPPPPPALPAASVALVWLRNDLRVADHPALHLAASAGTMVPVFVFDEARFGPRRASPWGFSRTGPFRAHFLRQSVRQLTSALRLRGSDVVLRIGDPVPDVLEVARELALRLEQDVHVVVSKETTWEETRDESRLQRGMERLAEELGREMKCHFVWSSTLHHPQDLPFNPAGPGVPKTFTAYRKLIEAQGGPDVRPELEPPEEYPPFPGALRIRSDPMPSLEIDLRVEGLSEPNDYPFPSPLGVHEFDGGCEKAMERIDEYFWKWKGLEEYKETRNSSGKRNCSSKLSPWLSLGCVSARSVYYQVRKFEEEHEATEHTYWMIFELMTRDYFRWISASVGTKLFSLNGYSGPGAAGAPVWNVDPAAVTKEKRELFEKWKEGMTGAPFVDASMRELNHTGFMSNRGRQNVASFLIHDIGFPDWRAGAEYFESLLIDHDVASNWGNWAYLAGVGSDPRGGRKFNVIKQSKQYDADAFFITRWCPELVDIPPALIHEPHRLTPEELKIYRVELGKTYPKPIVPLPRAPES